jgi:uncharacterized membrane protein
MRRKPATPKHRRDAPDRRAGLAAVEAALIMPLLLLLMTGLFDLGFAVYENMQVQSAADAGAQYASKNAWDVVKITAVVVGATGGGAITATPAPSTFCACPTGGTLSAPVVCTINCANGNAPSLYGLVSAQKLHSTVISYPGLPKPLTLSGEARARLP